MELNFVRDPKPRKLYPNGRGSVTMSLPREFIRAHKLDKSTRAWISYSRTEPVVKIELLTASEETELARKVRMDGMEQIRNKIRRLGVTYPE